MGGDSESLVSDSNESQIEVRPISDITFFNIWYSELFFTSGSKSIDLHAYIDNESATFGYGGSNTLFDHHNEILLPPKCTIKIKTNVRFKFPPRLYGMIKDVDYVAMRGVFVKGGVIDNDYTGEIFVTLYNHSNEVFEIFKGRTIAQLVVMKYPKTKFKKNPTTEEFDPEDKEIIAFGGIAEYRRKIQEFFERQEAWRQLEDSESKHTLKLLHMTTPEEFYNYLTKHPELSEIRPPFQRTWFDEKTRKWHYRPDFHVDHQLYFDEANEQKQAAIQTIFKNFNEKAEQENATMLAKQKFTVDLDEEEEKQDKDKYKLFEKFQSFKRRKLEPTEDDDNQPGPSTRIVSEVKSSSYRTWKEEKIKSGQWIDDPEEYKRQQEAKGLEKKTFKTKDGRFYSRWIPRKRTQQDAKIDDNDDDDDAAFNSFLSTIKSKRLNE